MIALPETVYISIQQTKETRMDSATVSLKVYKVTTRAVQSRDKSRSVPPTCPKQTKPVRTSYILVLLTRRSLELARETRSWLPLRYRLSPVRVVTRNMSVHVLDRSLLAIRQIDRIHCAKGSREDHHTLADCTLTFPISRRLEAANRRTTSRRRGHRHVCQSLGWRSSNDFKNNRQNYYTSTHARKQDRS